MSKITITEPKKILLGQIFKFNNERVKLEKAIHSNSFIVRSIKTNQCYAITRKDIELTGYSYTKSNFNKAEPRQCIIRFSDAVQLGMFENS